MKWQNLISLVLAVAAAPLTGVSTTATPPETPPAPEAPAAATTPNADLSQLSPPVLGLVKMLNSGVSQDVISAYVQNSPTPFNLTAEDIIRLQNLGVSPSLTTAMLNHDKALRDNPHPAGLPAPGTQAPVATAPYTPSDSDLYSNLAPYGYWGDMPGYGPYWQPYGSLAYNYYPWPWLGFGFWWNFPGHGWCWFPHSHFNHFHGSSFAFHSHSGFNVGHVGGSTVFHNGTAFHNGTSWFHVGSGSTVVHSSSPWVSGGFHGGTGSGFHTGGSGTFHGSTGGGFHVGSGGGFHGGGGNGGGGGHR